MRPLECSRCHVVFCEPCIDKFVSERVALNAPTSEGGSTFLESVFVCPQGCPDLKVQYLHSYASSVLAQTLLTCPNQSALQENCCSVKVPYSEYVRHVTQTCGELQAQCACGMQLRQKEVRRHQNEECPCQLTECARCKLVMPRRELHASIEECLMAVLQANRELERRHDSRDMKASTEQKCVGVDMRALMEATSAT